MLGRRERNTQHKLVLSLTACPHDGAKVDSTPTRALRLVDHHRASTSKQRPSSHAGAARRAPYPADAIKQPSKERTAASSWFYVLKVNRLHSLLALAACTPTGAALLGHRYRCSDIVIAARTSLLPERIGTKSSNATRSRKDVVEASCLLHQENAWTRCALRALPRSAPLLGHHIGAAAARALGATQKGATRSPARCSGRASQRQRYPRRDAGFSWQEAGGLRGLLTDRGRAQSRQSPNGSTGLAGVQQSVLLVWCRCCCGGIGRE
jgi:hypothetical protein